MKANNNMKKLKRMIILFLLGAVLLAGMLQFQIRPVSAQETETETPVPEIQLRQPIHPCRLIPFPLLQLKLLFPLAGHWLSLMDIQARERQSRLERLSAFPLT